MNKSYIVDNENNVTVINNLGFSSKRDDKYTQNTPQILSLENLSETLQLKIKNLTTSLNEVKSKTKTMKILLPILTIVTIISLILVTGIIPIGIDLLSIPLCLIPITIVLEMAQIVALIKNNLKTKELNKKISHESIILKKTKKQIERLSKSQTPGETKKNKIIDIAPTYNYNFNTTDYFIENYLITKRAEEMTKAKNKAKKLTKAKKTTPKQTNTEFIIWIQCF